MAGPRKFEKYQQGEPLEPIREPAIEVPDRPTLYANKVSMYMLGLKAGERMPAGSDPEKLAQGFLGTPAYWLLLRKARRFAGYRDDGSEQWQDLPDGYRERVQFNFDELLDAFWAGWYGHGMLDRGKRFIDEKPQTT